MERIPSKIDSDFRFVLLASQRAEQIMRGAQPRIDPGLLKPTQVAMEEILTDAVVWEYGAEVEEEPEAEEAAELEAAGVETAGAETAGAETAESP